MSPLRAIHGNPKSAVAHEANLDDCGYRIELAGKTFLQPGDSVLLEDHLSLKDVDVLFFSPTEHNTFIDPSVLLINALEPDYILPQHWDTYRVTPENRFWANGYPAEVPGPGCRRRCRSGTTSSGRGERLVVNRGPLDGERTKTAE